MKKKARSGREIVRVEVLITKNKVTIKNKREKFYLLVVKVLISFPEKVIQ